MLYTGWRIGAYANKISKTEEEAISHELKTRFDSGDWSFYENDHTINIYYGPNQQKVNVSFQEGKCSSKRNGHNVTYHIVFESPFFGWKARDERAHRELCRKTIQKIPWRKQGFWLEDGAEIPIPTVKILRMK